MGFLRLRLDWWTTKPQKTKRIVSPSVHLCMSVFVVYVGLCLCLYDWNEIRVYWSLLAYRILVLPLFSLFPVFRHQKILARCQVFDPIPHTEQGRKGLYHKTNRQ